LNFRTSIPTNADSDAPETVRKVAIVKIGLAHLSLPPSPLDTTTTSATMENIEDFPVAIVCIVLSGVIFMTAMGWIANELVDERKPH